MATIPLAEALASIREQLLDSEGLVRAVASGRRKAHPAAQVGGRVVRRVELRYVDLKSGRHLQLVSFDETQAHAANFPVGEAAEAAVAELLLEPFSNWHLDSIGQTYQLRVTKKLDAAVSMQEHAEPQPVRRGHDRGKQRLLAEDDPVLVALGISDAQGQLKPTRQAKYRQVEEFLRLLDSAITDAVGKGHLRTPTSADPLRIVDLGCGNAYLTFAAQRFLGDVRKLPVRVVGVDVKQQSADHNSRVAEELGIEADFVVGTITEAVLPQPPDVVLALHACDTATDDALARAVEWEVRLVLAAPCCHHDIASQLRKASTPSPYAMLTRDGILRERFADTLTDALRASILRSLGYRVDVVEFVESAHTPRNTMVRATRTSAGNGSRAELDELVSIWSVRPRLAELLEGLLADVGESGDG